MSAPKGNKFAEGNSGGRPTLLTDEVRAKARGYLKWCEDNPIERVSDRKYDKDGNLIHQSWIKRLPNVARLARHIDVGRSTLQSWFQTDEEFTALYTALRSEEEADVLEQGIVGNYSQPMAVRIAASQFGYHEKMDTDVTSNGQVIAINLKPPDAEPTGSDAGGQSAS